MRAVRARRLGAELHVFRAVGTVDAAVVRRSSYPALVVPEEVPV